MQKDLQFLKTRANFIRFSYIEEMEKYLLAFESRLSSKNIKVRWMSEETELVDFICKSLPKNNYNKVCFDIPKISDSFFEKKNFIKKISIDSFENNNDTAENLVIQANFGVIENGSIVFINKLSKNCFNNLEKIFVILNINDLVVRQCDLELLLYIQKEIDTSLICSDIKIISSPPSRIISKKFQLSNEDNYSSEKIEIFLLLYDNDITQMLGDNVLRETLYCINCGKCKEVCPVYQQTKEFSPIELIKYHCKEENKKSLKLFENTTLCGNCNEVCPVQINFTQLIIYQKQKFAKRNNNHEKNIDLFKIFSKRHKMNKVNSKFRRYFFIKKYFGKNKKLTNYFLNNKEDFFNITKKITQQ
ncbi:MAG: 4Fe-4S dicluster domain-containing protein [Bacteroidales bacterium]|jgi:L-lactate utilization protein LutB|nr:4Fe-4S dicluster domain-containing protein [Bacteroidales bacterium]